METNKQTRDFVIDVLRILGIFLVILAHCHIPEDLFEIREFDVSMLVMISGISYLLSGKRHSEEKWLTYAWRRWKRLVFPVWIFLGIYFLLFYFVFHDSFSRSFIWKSFALTQGGIMFIWIFRVLFTTALLNPFLRKITASAPVKWLILLLSALFLTNDFLFLAITDLFPGLIGKLFTYLISTTIGYALLAFAGMCLYQADHAQRWLMFTLFFFTWLACFLVLHGASMQAFKNPPQLYYAAYGIWITCALYEAGRSVFRKKKTPAVIAFFSKHAMTIYMMHVLFYYLFEKIPSLTSLYWPLVYLIHLFAAVAACVAFVLLKNKIIRKR